MIRDFVNTIFPNNCVCCSEPLYRQEEFVCISCFNELPETDFEANTNNPAAKLLSGLTNFNTCIPLYYYLKAGKVQNILKSMKYKNGAKLCQHMGKQLGLKLQSYPSLQDITSIIPVPLHPKKQKIRGYNQSEMLADGVSAVLDIPVDTDILTRIHDNSTQTNKSRNERWQNVSHIFSLNYMEKITGGHILLIDDVITTGSTVEACCSVLNEATDIRISIATLATA